MSTTFLVKDMMKLLLTDSGVKNASIRNALLDLLGKPITESSALCIPTAGYGAPDADPGGPWRFISGRSPSPMADLGWKSVGVLELTALPSIEEARWVSWVREADVLLVNGGEALYLGHWMQESGLAALLPSLPDTVYVGLSAGSMVMAPRVGEEFVGWKPRRRTPRTRRRTNALHLGSSIVAVGGGRAKAFFVCRGAGAPQRRGPSAPAPDGCRLSPKLGACLCGPRGACSDGS
ncbi:Type 1 glutamine amidotransferase-like domain-containing protein [Streptomyces sp. NPDC005706]|uniref:Type 1 glutamine amidotransferase-like domain-containing protein n=1 Tax=Streptomyces sp. NPDC005706 TaxID=3157169 RepID=UPI0033E14760